MRFGMMASRLLALCLLFLLAACQVPSLFAPKQHGPREPGVVILLPGDGPYAGIASKILEGATLARDELRGHGINVTLAFIDTNKKGWQEKLHALPSHFNVVGGPIERTTYSLLKKNGLLSERTHFAFMNNLDGADEGTLAYRFFPSPNDQVEALVDFATEALKIHSFGAFYGTDDYSTKMASLFAAKVREKNASLRSVTYSSTDPKKITEQARALINPVQSGSNVLPQTSFEAVFLPASWRRVDSIQKAFVNCGEDRLVLLGTTSWEQSVVGKKLDRAERFELAVFPVAWNMHARVKALEKVAPDFWRALGYDFMQFAVNLNLHERATPPQVVQKANRSTGIVRLLAPLHWDARGIAHQKLFIHRVTSDGMAPMDVALFEKLRVTHRERAAIRMQGGASDDAPAPVRREVRADPAPIVQERVEQPAPRAPEPVLERPPQSSYKLRLPTKR
ncbi:MAG: hypothetical protein IJU76_01430 [Desulfovibrionaceae bacterium]|nr:hypothetical protein [Desulfovibrionaceae bacterium]